MQNKKLLYIGSGVLAFIFVIIIIVLSLNQAFLHNTISTNVKDDIKKSSPLIGDQFDIIETKEPVTNWVIVVVQPKNIRTDNAKIVYKRESDGSFTKVLGPGTSFSTNDLWKNKVPDKVIQELGVVSE